LAVSLGSNLAWADGEFYVIAGGGGVGTKISSLPYTIKSPGFYYLSGNLTYSGSLDGITVNSDNVTIDLMGFCLSGPGSSSESTGIISKFDETQINYKNVEVRNGSLTGWLNGFYGGYRSRALNLSVKNCKNGIILLSAGLVKNCIVDSCSNHGIFSSGGVTTGNTVFNCSVKGILGSGIISGNWVSDCPYGIDANGTISGNSIENCRINGILCTMGASVISNMVQTPSQATGIYIATADPCLVTQNTVSGPGTHFVPGGSGTINVDKTNAGF
jgi:hypothetical protein